MQWTKGYYGVPVTLEEIQELLIFSYRIEKYAIMAANQNPALQGVAVIGFSVQHMKPTDKSRCILGQYAVYQSK